MLIRPIPPPDSSPEIKSRTLCQEVFHHSPGNPRRYVRRSSTELPPSPSNTSPNKLHKVLLLNAELQDLFED